MVTDSRIGSDLAGYRIEGILGRGGMSVVYLAQHLRLDRRVALKVLAPDLAEDERFRERFIRESRIAARIEHPNIIPVYEAGEADGVLFIAMRYVRGTDLKFLIRSEGKLEPARAIHMLAQVGSALDAAHEDGLVHRDVKPGNILIAPGTDKAPREHVYLSDFGLTKRSSSESGITATGQFVGTLDYAAPEQFEGKALDGRTDVYSLGCVLYEVLTGEVPFRRDQDAAMMFAHLMSAPPTATEANPELPGAIDAVVARAMAKRPEDRYPTAGELIADARSALGVPSGEFAIVPGAPPSKARRPKWLVPGLAAVLAAMIATTAVLVATRGGTPPHATPSGPLTVTGNAAGVIDPRTDKLSAVVALPGVPTAIAAGDGAIWVAQQGGTVTRIDAKTHQTQTIGVGGNPTAIAVGPGFVWVLDATAATLTPIAASSSTVGTLIQLPTGTFTGLAVGYGSLWVAGFEGGINGINGARRGLFRIDPTDGKFSAHAGFDVNTGTLTIAIGEGSVWVTNDGQSVEKIAPQQTTLQGSLQYAPGTGEGGTADPISVGAGSVWVATRTTSSLYRIDPATDQVVGRTHIPANPTGVAVEGGRVWVSCSDGNVFEVDASSSKLVRTIHVGGTAVGITVSSDGTLWVAAQKA